MVKIFKQEKGKKQVLESYDRILEMWPAAYREHEVKTGFGTTHCITAGSEENPPLLLFHGVGDNAAVMWVLNIEELSKHFYCIAVDTIGGPGKSVPNGEFRKGSFDQVAWIHQIADYFQLETFHVAGVSNGAYMAYNYTAAAGGRVKKAVCMEGGMVVSPLKSMARTLLLLFPEILLPTRNNLLRIMKKLSAPGSDLFEKYPFLAEHLILLMQNHHRQAMFAHKLELYDKAKGIAVREKLYFLVAEHGLANRKDFLEILDDGGFRYNVIQDAGHGINHEQPERIHAELIRFLIQENEARQ